MAEPYLLGTEVIHIVEEFVDVRTPRRKIVTAMTAVSIVEIRP